MEAHYECAEMKNFIGIIMCMGLVNMHDIQLYWSKMKQYKYDNISDCMTRDRFILMQKFLHFAGNSSNINNDRLYKIRPLLDGLLKNVQYFIHQVKV